MRGANLPAAGLNLLLQRFEFVFGPRRRQRGARGDQGAPFCRVRIGGDVWLPRFRARGGGFIRNVRGVVFVRQAGEVMAEFVHEDVRRKGVVRRYRGVQVEDPAATVFAVVHDDLDDLVGGGRGGFAHALVVKRKHVTLGAEGIVGGAQGGSAIDAIRRARHSALVRRSIHGPHGEIGAAFLEGRSGEQRIGHAARVLVPLIHLRGGVPVAHQQQVHFVARFAVLHHRPNSYAGRRAGAVDGRVRRIDGHGPQLPKRVPAIACLHDEPYGGRARGEPERLVKLAANMGGLGRFPPLSEDAGEPARIQHAGGRAVYHFEVILAQVGVVYGAIQAARPRPFEHQAVERHLLFGGRTAVETIQAHGSGIGRPQDRKGYEEQNWKSQTTTVAPHRGFINCGSRFAPRAGRPSFICRRRWDRRRRRPIVATMPVLLVIQIQIERQNVDARLTEDAELAAFHVLVHDLADSIRGRATGLRHAVHLGIRRCRADMRVETAGGGGQQVGRYGTGVSGILLAEFLDIVPYAVDESLVSRSKVSSSGVSGIIAIAGRGRTSMEILGLGELLPDQFGPYDLAICPD